MSIRPSVRELIQNLITKLTQKVALLKNKFKITNNIERKWSDLDHVALQNCFGKGDRTAYLCSYSRLRVFENRVLRRIFGPKRYEVTGEGRRLHNEELNDLYSSSNIIRVIKSRRMRWAVHVAHMGEGIDAYRILVGRPDGRRTLGRTRSRWKNNIKMDLQQVRWEGRGLDWYGSG
jgi:hypothetical protein